MRPFLIPMSALKMPVGSTTRALVMTQSRASFWETPAAWPSFMTGKNPGKHGVFDFLVYDPIKKRERPVNSTIRDGKAIWDYLTEAGKTSLVLHSNFSSRPCGTPFLGELSAV